MCLINCGSKSPEPDVLVAPRPVPIPLQSAASPRYSAIAPSPRTSQVVYAPAHPSPRASQTSYILSRSPQPQPPSPSGRVVVIQQRTPRTSGPLVVGQGYSYGPGVVAVPVRAGSVSRPGISVQGGHGRSGSIGVERRSASALYGADPRASNTSYRSTRERVVVVDGKGTRREYYR